MFKNFPTGAFFEAFPHMKPTRKQVLDCTGMKTFMFKQLTSPAFEAEDHEALGLRKSKALAWRAGEAPIRRPQGVGGWLGRRVVVKRYQTSVLRSKISIPKYGTHLFFPPELSSIVYFACAATCPSNPHLNRNHWIWVTLCLRDICMIRAPGWRSQAFCIFPRRSQDTSPAATFHCLVLSFSFDVDI